MPMLHNLVQVCYDEQIRVRCARTRAEMRGVIYLDDDDSTAGAPRGAHDDLVMPLGQGVLVASQRQAFRRVTMPVLPRDRDLLFPRTGR